MASRPRAPSGGSIDLAISTLYHDHRLGLTRLAILLVDDEETASDVVQDAFAGLYQRWDRLADPTKAQVYLRSAVINNSRSVLRRRRTVKDRPLRQDVRPRSPESLAVLGDEHRAVVEALDTLTDRQREVLVLRYWSGLSEADIAEATGLSRGAVKSTASRAIDALELAMARGGK